MLNENRPVMSQTLSPAPSLEQPRKTISSGDDTGVRKGSGSRNRAAVLRPLRITLFYIALFGLWWIVAARQIWTP